MTLLRVAEINGFALEYDTDDVLGCEIETPRDLITLPPTSNDRGVRHALGDAHLHLHVHFKPGTGPRWVELDKEG